MPITAYIRQQLYTPIIRLRLTPDEPEGPPPASSEQPPPAIAGPRRCRRRPHTAGTIAKVRDLFEHTGLTRAERAARGLDGASRGAAIAALRIDTVMVFPRSLFDPPLVRLRVEPDQPAHGPPAITEQRPRGSRRPYTDLVVAKVKHLVEHTA